MTKWLDRSLVVGPHLTLVLSQKECNKAFAHCRLPKEDWGPWIKTPQADATLHWFENGQRQMVCVVAIRPRPEITGIQIASLLVHEAVHIWQHFKQRIGEDLPSIEFEAYSIQSIAQRLMEAYAERIEP